MGFTQVRTKNFGVIMVENITCSCLCYLFDGTCLVVCKQLFARPCQLYNIVTTISNLAAV